MIGNRLSHYLLVEQIGAGGMGVVYRAHDEQLERDVALKVLPAGMVADENSRRRFRKEALSLARLNHPNVAMVFEFGSQDGVDFLVTEFIPGVTLDASLSHAALPVKQVVDLGIQLAQGLCAAHEQGIVHRDLKPGNLRLTPDGRLKILDFGLAELGPKASDLGLTVTVTQSQEITGTLPYMAPEQLRAETVDFRSDIWSAGAVLYEMATGVRPFSQRNGPLLIDAILNQNPESPGKLNPQISASLENVIVKALDKDPKRRYQSANELRVDLERIAASSGAWAAGSQNTTLEADVKAKLGAVSAESRKRKKRLLVVSVAVVCFMIAIAGGYIWHRRFTRAAITPAGGRRSVAVLGFKNLGRPDQMWLSNALAEMLTTELSAGDKLRTIPGENVARMKSDQSLPEADALSPKTLSGIYQTLGSDLVVLGSYLDIGGQVRVDLRVQDTANGETIAQISDSEAEAQFLDLVKRIGETLRQKCGAGEISSEEAAAVRAAEPATSDAARLYAEGIRKFRSFDHLAARDLLDKALAADPNNVMAHTALAATWTQLGYDDKAKDEAKRAFDLSHNLSRKDSLSIEAEYREANREWGKAVELYKSLWTFFPDDLEYGLRLVDAQVGAATPQEALATISSLRSLPHPLRDDPRIDLAEAHAADSLSDYKLAQTAAARAAIKAHQINGKFLQAQALLQQCWALRNTGELTKAAAIGERARATLAAAGDFRGEAKSLTCLANILQDQGDLSKARTMHEKALALARQIGSEQDIAGALINIGNLLASQQALDDSSAQYNEALAVALRIGDQSDALIAQNNLAANLMLQGDFAAAKKLLLAAVDTARQVGDQSSVIDALINLATISYWQGDLNEADKDLETSLASSRELGLKSKAATALVVLGDIRLAQDDLPAAEKNYSESLAIRTELGEKGGMAATQVSLAMLALEQNQPTKAESLAKAAASEFHAEKDSDQETAAHDAIAQSLIARGKLADAQSEINVAKTLSVRDQPTRLSLLITSARLLARSGKTADASHSLQEALDSATQLKLPKIEFLARLAQIEIQAEMADSVAARSSLQHLRKDANDARFLLIARKAAKRLQDTNK